MPKETIYADQLPFGTPGQPGPARSVIEVLWGRETEHVQVATKCIDAETGEVFDGSGLLPSPNDPSEPPSFYGGFYVDLDRKGINNLIRKLRRARDQAFGRDE